MHSYIYIRKVPQAIPYHAVELPSFSFFCSRFDTSESDTKATSPPPSSLKLLNPPSGRKFAHRFVPTPSEEPGEDHRPGIHPHEQVHETHETSLPPTHLLQGDRTIGRPDTCQPSFSDPDHSTNPLKKKPSTVSKGIHTKPYIRRPKAISVLTVSVLSQRHILNMTEIPPKSLLRDQLDWRCGCGHLNPDCDNVCNGCGKR